MTRRKLSLMLVIAVVGVAAAVAQAGSSKVHHASMATVELEETGLGKILANSAGHTLYVFTRDERDKDMCVTTGGCATVWPPLLASGSPTAGGGVTQKLLGTIRLPGGEMQVTYKGRPLYLYSGDTGPGRTSYVGASEFGGRWPALNAKGRTVTARSGGGGDGW